MSAKSRIKVVDGCFKGSTGTIISQHPNTENWIVQLDDKKDVRVIYEKQLKLISK